MLLQLDAEKAKVGAKPEEQKDKIDPPKAPEAEKKADAPKVQPKPEPPKVAEPEKKVEVPKVPEPEKKAATASMMGLGITSEKSFKKVEPPVTGRQC